LGGAPHMSAVWGKADMTLRESPLSQSLLGVKRTCHLALHMSADDHSGHRIFLPSVCTSTIAQSSKKDVAQKGNNGLFAKLSFRGNQHRAGSFAQPSRAIRANGQLAARPDRCSGGVA